MNGYDIPDDGNLHVNYSSLKRCTSVKGVMSVIAEQKGEKLPFDGETVQLGKIRHAQWEKESKQTGYTPTDFAGEYRAKVDFIEQSFAVNIFKGVVLHFRPDTVSLSDEAVIDNKKVVKGARQFLNDHQLIIYAYGLQLHGYRIRRTVHLCEMWNRDPEEPRIIGYQVLVRELKLYDIAAATKWLRTRVNYLIEAQKILT